MRKLKSVIDRSRRTWHRLCQSAATAVGDHNLLLITDEQGWILDDFSQLLLEHLADGWRGRVIDIVPHGVKGKTLHFVERYRFLRLHDPTPLAEQNHVVLTWWHGGSGDSENIHLEELLKSQLEHVLGDREAFSSRARQRVLDEFRPAVVFPRYLKVIEEGLSAPPRVPLRRRRVLTALARFTEPVERGVEVTHPLRRRVQGKLRAIWQ